MSTLDASMMKAARRLKIPAYKPVASY